VLRRVVPAAFAGLGAIGLLAAFQSSPSASPATVVAGPTVVTTAPVTSPTTTTGAPPTRPPAPPTTTPSRPGTPPPTTPATPPTTPTRPTTPTTAPPGTGGPKSGVFDGSVEQNRYGPVQVRITVQGGRITDVQAVQLPSDRARSQRISDIAGPILRQEALQAQSARIDVVSGATYTSTGYARSLQRAIDAANR
jgi:uncharacterized protein with FMN-binding domain